MVLCVGEEDEHLLCCCIISTAVWVAALHWEKALCWAVTDFYDFYLTDGATKWDGTQFMSDKSWLIHSEVNGVHSSSTSSQQPVQLQVLLSKKSLNIWTHLHMYVCGICGTRWWSSRQQSKWDLLSGASNQLFTTSNSGEKQDWRLKIGSWVKCRQIF